MQDWSPRGIKLHNREPRPVVIFILVQTGAANSVATLILRLVSMAKDHHYTKTIAVVNNTELM